MKLIAYKALCLSAFLALVLACVAGTIYAQSERPGDQSIEPGDQAGSISGQGGMEGMRGGQADMGQMT